MNTIADRFIKMRNTINVNKSQFAQNIQTTPSIVGEIESGKREPSKNILIKLLNIYSVNINWLLSGEGSMFLKSKIDNFENDKHAMNNFQSMVSEYNIDRELENINSEWIGKSSKYILEDSNQIIEQQQKNINLIKVINADMKSNNVIQIPNELKNYEGKLVAVIQKGDDMEPIIKDSSIVLCDTEGYQGAGMYVIKINNIYMVKRISIKPNYYIIKSDNKLYDSFEVHIDDEQLKIGGKVRFVANVFY